MRDDPYFGGSCPVVDESPVPFSSNLLAIEMYRKAEGSANQVDGKDKVYIYLLPSEVRALMDVHRIPEDEREGLMDKILTLQNIANDMRPNRPKKINTKHTSIGRKKW